MPTLDFKGKQFVYAHHLTVPFRQLNVEAKKSLPQKGEKPGLDDNLIIHGDNLHALKALLPKYAGKVKCIHIDPPYNTGNEGWCYNDNVNAPLIKEWLKDSANPVDKEDLERHDKWLSMMWPRLQLLRELLAEDGVFFASIDNNEAHYFKSILGEIFGENNFIEQITWKRKTGSGTGISYVFSEHEYVLCFARNINNLPQWRMISDQDGNFKNPDNDPEGKWESCAITAPSKNSNPNQLYMIEVHFKD
jgi:adenine-specific DNA-methyltransferase